MGVPVVTLAGRTHASRIGTSILTNVGQERFVAKNAENYVRLAVELANDRKELLRLRGELRASMQQSPLMDAKTFSGNVEAAYRQMWRQLCAGAPQLESSTA
jgi:predicted O-linked N-acetylglucosamine transferase (SPINDLY family)